MKLLYMPSKYGEFQEDSAIELDIHETTDSTPEYLAEIAARHYYNERDGWEHVEEWDTEGIAFWIKTADELVEVQTLLDFHPIFINEIKTSQS